MWFAKCPRCGKVYRRFNFFQNRCKACSARWKVIRNDLPEAFPEYGLMRFENEDDHPLVDAIMNHRK